MRRPLLAAGLATALLTATPAAGAADDLLLSRPSGFGALPPAANHASGATISADGRYVAFVSTGDGLVDGDDDRVQNVYVRDRVTRTTTLVSRDYPQQAPGAAPFSAGAPSISADGTKVAFTAAPDRGDKLDRARFDDVVAQVFVRDLVAGTTVLASRAGGDGAAADAHCAFARISGDGRVVVFGSAATTLGGDGFTRQAWRRELTGARTTTLVSRTTAGAPSPTSVLDLAVDDDGSRVAFATDAALDPTDANGASDVYLRDVTGTPRTTLVSTRSGSPATEGNGDSFRPALDADGDRVAFTSRATNLGSDGSASRSDVFVRTLGPGNATVLASVRPATEESGADHPAIDGSGDVVAYETDARDVGDIHARRIAAAETVFVAAGKRPSLGAAAAAIAFESDATDLRDDDPDDYTDVFAVSAPGPPDLVSRPSGDAPWLGLQNDAGEVRPRSISADGGVVVFSSRADGLSTADDDRLENVYARDTRTGTTTLLSAGSALGGTAPIVSADGRRAAWTDAQSGDPQVRAADVATGEELPVPGDVEVSGETLALTADGGQVVARTAYGDERLVRLDLAAGTVTELTQDGVGSVFGVSDDGAVIAVQHTRGDTIHVRRLADGTERTFPHEDSAWDPVLSADGARVAYLEGDAVRVAETKDGGVELARIAGAYAFVLSPDGRTVATYGDSAGWVVHRVAGGDPLPLEPEIESVAFSADAACLAYARPGGAGSATTDVRHVFRRDLVAGACPLPPVEVAPPGPSEPDPPVTGTAPAETAPPAPTPAASPTPPRLDRTAPRITRLGLSRTRIRVRGRGVKGATFRLTLSERATLRIAFARCPRRVCARALGTISRRGVGPGRVSARFDGRVGRRLLRAGSYRATVTATDAAGNRSAARTIRFTVR